MEGSSNEDDGLMQDNADLNGNNINTHQIALDGGMHIVEAENSNPISHEHDMEMAEPFVGMEFESEEAAKLFYMAYASRYGFSVRISKSRRSRNDESIIMRRFVCSKEGFHMKKDNFDDGKKKRKRATIREGCNAMIEVIQKYYGRWVATKFVKEHNHVVAPPSRVRFVAPEEFAHIEPFLGMEFHSHEDAQTFYYAYASRVGFEVRIRLSRRSTRDESFVMRRFVCTKEGHSSPYEENYDDNKRKRTRAPAREGCKAMFEVIKKEFDRWIVSKLVAEHTHTLAIAPSKVHYIQSESEVVVLAKSGGGVREKSAVGTSNTVLQCGDSVRECPNDDSSSSDQVPKDENRESFFKIEEDTQNLLEYFKRMQAENHTFFYAFQVDKNNSLTNIFWADAKSKMAYYYFGDAVTFDTSYKDNQNMIPFVTFTGVNHHLQSVIFGCALLTDESESSYIWLFEKWIAAMGRAPLSLTIDQNETLMRAVTKVFPDVHRQVNRWSILSKCREKLSNIYDGAFEAEFENCVNDSETIEAFEWCWNSLMDRYKLRENTWLHSIYDMRQQWVSVYLKHAFCTEVSSSHRPDSMNKFFEKYFNKKTSLLVFVSLFEQAMSSWAETEALEDFANMYTKPNLKMPSVMLKQAAELYTRSVFEVFQDEFVESLGYFCEKINDGEIVKYNVARDGGKLPNISCRVSYNSIEKKAKCSCCKFEVNGILCRHILRVFLMVGVRSVPDDCMLKRWTKNAKSGYVLDECIQYNDLCRDAIKYAKEGASSMEIYKVAKESLQIAYGEVIAAKKDIGNRCTI
ncbi:FAR1-related sequence 5 [Zostera marina]|uniref:Protein FAR1-RELATED SEQUENCE n=1 Tax=Zostera marina TaxID=29655 RepID=A0A0K9PUS4_ZOSMR|nr:FAR1-related sequence 5 [Zostera marina]